MLHIREWGELGFCTFFNNIVGGERVRENRLEAQEYRRKIRMVLMSSCSQTKTLSLSYNDINITLCWLNTISSHLWASNRCVIAFHRSFRLYEVSQRPYYFTSTPPTCHKLFCFTIFPFSLPAVLILLADLQVDPAKWLLITQKDLYSPSLHGGLVWAIIIWDYLYLKYLHTWQARAEVSFSCTATCQQEVMLGWDGLRGS